MSKKSPARLTKEIAAALLPETSGVRIVPSEKAGYTPGKFVVQYKGGNGIWFDIGDPKSRKNAEIAFMAEAKRVR